MTADVLFSPGGVHPRSCHGLADSILFKLRGHDWPAKCIDQTAYNKQYKNTKVNLKKAFEKMNYTRSGNTKRPVTKTPVKRKKNHNKKKACYVQV